MKQGEENKKQPYDYAGLMREIRLEGRNLGESFGKTLKEMNQNPAVTFAFRPFQIHYL